MEHFVIFQVSRHGYLAIFILMAIESACIPIPSEAIMLFGGALTAEVVIAGTTGHLSRSAVAVIGALGNVLGSAVAYLIGRTGGRTVVERWGRYLLIRHHDLDRAERFFARRGQLAVLIGRLLPVVRTFISFPAGVSEMPFGSFAFLTLIGSLPWTFGLAYVGQRLAANWQTVANAATPISMVIAVLLVAVVACWYLKRRGATA